MDANYGGTEIYQPLEAIFKQPFKEGFLRQIFVLTDGEVSNSSAIVELVKKTTRREECSRWDLVRALRDISSKASRGIHWPFQLFKYQFKLVSKMGNDYFESQEKLTFKDRWKFLLYRGLRIIDYITVRVTILSCFSKYEAQNDKIQICCDDFPFHKRAEWCFYTWWFWPHCEYAQAYHHYCTHRGSMIVHLD